VAVSAAGGSFPGTSPAVGAGGAGVAGVAGRGLAPASGGGGAGAAGFDAGAGACDPVDLGGSGTISPEPLGSKTIRLVLP